MSEEKTQNHNQMSKGNVNVNDGKDVATTTKDVATSKPTNLPEILTQEDLTKLNYVEFDTPAKLLALSTVLVKSKLCPLKSPEDAFMAIQTGKELGLPFVTSVSQIYPIEGKPTLGVHIIRGLLITKGIFFNRTHDCEDYYEFAIKDGEGKFSTIKKGFVDEQPNGTVKKKIDVRTRYEFERDVKSPSGSWRTLKISSSFGLTDVMSAGLNEKQNYVKHFPRMLDARAFAIGSREIAADILLGIHTPQEMIDANPHVQDVDYSIDEEGTETIVVSD